MVELDCAGQEIPFGREGGIHLTGGAPRLENRTGKQKRWRGQRRWRHAAPPREAGGQEPPPVARALPVAVPAVISRLR